MFEKIIEHQANLILEERNLIGQITDFEYLRIKYDIALKLLNELS